MMIKAKMKILLQLVVWIFIAEQADCHGIGFGIKKEIFFLNLEDGYFGCQVNESTDFLQLYELSRLCDGRDDCYMGSDELARELKCTRDCNKQGPENKCLNGACLDSQCHCNDGFGGCSCEVPDENECKSRPCDVFAHCTNTLGSFHCTCFPGYAGDGFHCQDINECEDPLIAARCVPNSECCNLPAHFLCKCLPGFQGDGEEECIDIDECLQPGACGPNAICQNIPGNYTCTCQPGFEGNPLTGCTDIDECTTYQGACGLNAICSNTDGGYICACPLGSTGDPFHGACIEIDECLNNPCGLGAICTNTPASYTCICPPGFVGDPYHTCSVIGCVDENDCPSHQSCYDHTCQDPCAISNPCAPYEECQVHEHHPACVKVCQCQKDLDCQVNSICDGCRCIPQGEDRVVIKGCEHCPPGLACDQLTGACIKDADASTPSHTEIPTKFTDVTIKTDTTITPPTTTPSSVDETDVPEKMTEQATKHATDIETTSEMDRTTVVNDKTESNIVTTESEMHLTDSSQSSTEISGTAHDEESTTSSNFDLTESNIETTASSLGTTESPSVEMRTLTEIPSTSSEIPVFSTEKTTEFDEPTTVPQPQTTSSVTEDLGSRSEVESTDETRPEHDITTVRVTDSVSTESIGSTTQLQQSEETTITNDITTQRTTTTKESATTHEISEDTTVITESPITSQPTTSKERTEMTIPEAETIKADTEETFHATEMTTSRGTTFGSVTSTGEDETTAETNKADTEETFHATEVTTSRGTTFGSGTSTEEGETTAETIKAGTEETFHATEMTTSRGTTLGSVTSSEEGETTVITSDTTIKQPEEVTSTTTPLSQTSGTTEGITEVTLSMQTTSEPESFKFDGETTSTSITTPLSQTSGTTEGITEVTLSMQTTSEPESFKFDGETTTVATEASSEAETTGTIDKSVEFLETTAPSLTEAPSTESQTEEMKTTQSFSTQSTNEESLSTLSTISGGEGVTESVTSSTEAEEETSKVDDTTSETTTIGTTEDFHKMTEATTSEITTSSAEEGSEPTTVTESFTTLITKMLTDIPSFTTKMFTTTESSETTMQTTEEEETEITTAGEAGSTTTVGTTSDMQQTESTEQETSAETTTSDTGKATETVAATTMVTSTEGHETTTETREVAETETPTPSSEVEVSTESTSETATEEMTTVSNETHIDTTTVSSEMTTVTDSETTKSEETTTELTEGTTFEGSTTVTSETTATSPMTTTESIPSTTTKLAHRKTVLIQTIFGDLIKCKDDSDCEKNEVCSNRVCKPCPLGTNTVDCQRAPIGRPKKPQPCEKDTDCLESEACYNGMCEDLCGLANLCAPTAKCHVVKHRPVCTCPPGHQGNPAVKCFLPKPLTCIKNEDCGITEACIGHTCQHPCDVHNPCAQNAVCINTNHGCDCVCSEGYYGNGYVGCIPGLAHKSVCQYNEDCPDDKLCDRLNRVCINPCSEDSCGENAQCIPVNHGTDCRCLPGYVGNAYLMCSQVSGCHSNLECPTNEACIQGRCGNPCNCGPNAICDVISHKPICKCLPGYGGNAKLGCTGPLNPCDPNPCGINAHCEVDAGGPICFCPKGMTGNPFKNCIPEGNECSPNPCGPNSGCRVVHGSPVCFCLPEYEGNPPRQPCTLPRHPCNPSPCGPNTQCSVLDNGFAKCTCLPGYIESPNTIRGCVERTNPCYPNPCGHGALCDRDRNPPCYCPDPLVGNPYRTCAEPMKSLCQPGPCGLNADCYISGNTEQCYCQPGTTGDPYTICNQPPRTACWPNPCGPLAVCTVTPSGHSMCLCPDGMAGDPTTGCGGPQCVTDDDCTNTQACVGHRCIDPCPGSCGFGANCRVEKHHPICTCNHGLIGNPLCRCFLILGLEGASRNPCEPSPCGLNTNCRVANGRPVCSCLPHYLGDPKTGCRPECILNSDCPSDSACIYQRCIQPCSSTNVCGLGAICTCSDHTPFCSCPPGYHGDPYIQCIPSPIVVGHNTTLPCAQSPCGPDAVCSVYGQVAMCNPCGKPESAWDPKCRPECLADSDCPYDKACLNYRCISPCPGSCGVNAHCTCVHHKPVCSCPPDYIGNPFEHCAPRPPDSADRLNTCDRIRCGSNAKCHFQNGVNVCRCLPNFYGDPYLGCHPECVINSDCGYNKACINYKCVDPCSGACGVNALCTCVNHIPICHCPDQHTGDPFVTCYPINPALPPSLGHPGNPCDPSPCGPNSRCIVSHQGFAVCSCLPGYRGVPPVCQPDCLVSSECLPDRACINQKCTDPCPGLCGIGARCLVMNHNPVCSCPPGQVGDPFIRCHPSAIEEPKIPSRNPCEPTPCGPNSICIVREGRPVCSCSANYIGSPPYCRPECVMSQECPHDQACIQEKCKDPCSHNCGTNAQCHVVNHTPFCSCLPGYQGDAFVGCYQIPITVVPEKPNDPCDLWPCAENAQCSNINGVARCTCIPPYVGDPYSSGCKPECLINADCAPTLACLSSHCRDPCPGVCGNNAQCSVVNHIAVCTCFEGYIGDPFQSCRPKPVEPVKPINPCDPNPCGANSVCRVQSETAACSCIQGYIGVPPSCRPECIASSECNLNKACINQKCIDPCPGTCGLHANCHVINHNPICSCPPKTVGDPFVRCIQEVPKVPVEVENPCMPSPCGGNSQCRVVDHRPVCSCLPGMLGAPPNCRPECLIHADCPNRLACIGSKCKDPCVGSCGFNALCNVVNHQPICSCQQGYHGDPFSGCSLVVIVPELKDPCLLSPCGSNAVCEERNGAGACTCAPGYFGDPYIGCRPECVLNTDCPWDKSCQNNKCRNPCSGACGSNAECRVAHHSPYCTCLYGYSGNPLVACHILVHVPPLVEEEQRNPCVPSPCGPYSECKENNGYGACSCLPGYIGVPPACRPECVVSSECALNRACVNKRCTDPCPGTCGINARCQVINHNAICSCLPGYTGDPFVRCIVEHKPTEIKIPGQNPCIPNICGPNALCKTVGRTPVCSCLPNYIGRPPNCRPECTINADCSGNQVCQNELCTNPCPSSCGVHALCSVSNHAPFCSCLSGYSGDPFVECSPIIQSIQPELPRDPCNPSPCGPNAICKERNGAGSCTCLPEYSGDPYSGCRPECVLNTDCPRDKACSNNKCRNPCPGICGSNAECRVVNHAPSCSCLPGYTGNPLTSCHLPPPIEPQRPKNPCIPSPCGPYSICRVTNNHAVCSCQANYVGSPPACRPECMISADCAQDKACLNQKCADPCPGTCGLNARCQVVNHNPICSCPPGFKGDPFARCLKEEKRPVAPTPSGNPCVPSPCGPNSQCRPVGNTPACSCSPNYVGRPPNCRPECTINAECAGNLACQNERCRDPCPGSCGPQATCRVIKHNPQCSCLPGYTGDPFAGCSLIQQIAPTEGPKMPCNPSPCGANAVCKERNGAGSCACLPEYFGDPYTGCRPECVVNTDCDRSKACMNNKCKDPCPGTCGLNAECHVVNHAPSCTCLPGFVGDPISACRPTPSPEPEKPGNPCQPSPCGPYSACRVIDNHAVCSCQANYIGSPPACRPECMISPDCAQDKACLNQKCGDPCPGTCGLNARCQVVNHNPICSCSPGFSGDPFSRCLKEEKPVTPVPSGNPCVPSPCGPNSVCRSIGNTPACSCSPNYIGRPPNCRPECTINAECAGNLACQNERCRDPCPGSCGPHAACQVVKHNPQCSCLPGYTGDPFAGCSLIQQIAPTEGPRRPCNPSPCGANAVCKERNGAGSCSCLPEYFGDPYTGCRPECVTNAECDKSKACVNNKCKDPCIGTCGLNAECRVINHAPSCTCLHGYSGNPLSSCTLIQSSVTERPQNPCVPSPCGPNSICKEIKNHAVCTCQPNFVGSPPTCRPECIVSSECQQDKACINQRCSDPCPGTCGLNARCQVLNHNPICSCSPGFTGDPFVRCLKQKTPTTPTPPTDPCQPSPCGPYSQCRSVGTTPACSCLTNYIGQPPNCRPECIRNAECASNLACQKERCIDPCPGSCGYLAQCKVVNHNAICTCPQGYVGDATTSCQPAPVATTERTPEKIDPCFPSPCGANAECHNRNGVGACSCLAGFQGDPYTGCRRECESNVDCATALACIGFKCVNPCPGTCGTGAECTVANHIPICSCPPGFTGDPFFSCHQAPPSRPPKPQDPCFPSPCGPNSQCRTVNQQAVCSCMANYIGNPPTCRPECVVNSECTLDKACINQKCADPCPNTCGLHAQCTTKNHNPICACPQGYTGDPFSQCHLILVTPVPPPTREPLSCSPSPCGPNSQCQIVRDQIACSCLPNYLGNPPNCRPECVISSECSSQLACINQKCKDPCTGSCGANANCRVVNHVPVCSCDDGYTGDPFTFCSPVPLTTPTPPASKDPCNPSPCGPNAVCRDGLCECVQDYNGNPYEACRPECVLHTECSRDKACFRNKCRDPCPGTCGQNAQCDVVNHIPTCSCPQAYTGDPFTLCRPLPTESVTPADPCNPSPCGPNSQCRAPNNVAVCSCLPGFMGSPPACRPECLQSAECSQTQACVNKKCTDPCLGSCGLNARCQVINHSPICSCPPGQTGDPFRSCYDIPVLPPPIEPVEVEKNPCQPSPCGPNSQCLPSQSGQPSCSCMTGYIGSPPNCRPECVINPDCPSNQACINNKCVDPCPGTCGINAQCSIISHAVACTCLSGFTGNAFVQCVEQKQEVKNPCEPSPCGPNAECTQRNGAGSCSCIQDYTGNPYEGCRPECVLSSDCPTNKACVRNKCEDPCPGVCGQNAQCSVINHIPTCTCVEGYVGNPFVVCSTPPPPVVTQATVTEPCSPSPCGSNSQCRNVNNQAVCSCAPDFQGTPPNCRPECVVNSECPTNRACYKNKCTDPCPGTCGLNARCQVINHNPICSCPTGQTGDPFTRCYLIPATTVQERPLQPVNPCTPSPCGSNSVCQVTAGNQASCSCLPSYIGSPPNCRPECVVNTDCPLTQACITEKCRDPCIGSCGLNAECRVQNHIPTCSCTQGFTGDPFTQCSPIPPAPTVPTVKDPCNPSPCGANANCNNGQCTCLPDYFGDPYIQCRPECTMNSDCTRNKACSNQHCIDPCPGTCGQGATCDVINHIPTCSCPPQTTGDPFTSCRPRPVEPPRDPCNPSPCGANSICRVSDGHAVCTCQSGMIGTPPQCRPECVVSAECPLTQACLNSKCRDPCVGTCGLGAKCNVVNHNPICSCPPGQTGDPFRQCYPTPVTPKPVEPVDPCRPSPCGPNSDCKVLNGSPACSCLSNYIGAPPNCRPECTINPECAPTKACVNQRCIDPCPGSCGSNARCSVINHTPICSCNAGFTGDPFTACSPLQEEPPRETKPVNPCLPSPCGPNAVCRIEGTYAVCECSPEYQGNPYEGCRPECVVSSDCAMSRACIRNKCRDPCPGTCGLSAICTVSNHIPICSCPEGYEGNAFTICTPVPKPTPEVQDPCIPSPCGPNTQCNKVNENAVCSCLPGFQGVASGTIGCRPECVISPDCPRNRACVNNKCVDPCPGVCGYLAICHVVNHSPICSCPPQYNGDPFVECQQIPVVPDDPCNPSPCGQNGQCHVVNGVATCIYPECVINQDCPRDKACYTQKCRDPCSGACGLNAICQTVNHKAVCSCPRGYIGEPRIQCQIQPQVLPKPECSSDQECANNKACINQVCSDPCQLATTSVCAYNAECRVQMHRPLCVCREGLTGNAQNQCFDIGCRSDSECPPSESCVNKECVDPCRYTQCGTGATCERVGGKARCRCPPGYFGDSLVRCERPQCTSDSECPSQLACRNLRCQNPCDCAKDALCTVTTHIPTCRCPPGYIGNPHQSCTVAPVVGSQKCKMDADCSSKLACFSGDCRNPCIETNPCGDNAECLVVDTLPLRTMSCQCLPGFIGDADVKCTKAPQEGPGCSTDLDCVSSEICVNRKCVNPCEISNPCAKSAICQPINHKAVCKCPDLLVGDPFVNCYKVPVTSPECKSDSDCPSPRACINQRCQDPCIVNNPCGTSAECTTIQHRPTCTCPQGWAGNPQIHCYKPECKEDADCVYDKACIGGNCISPCGKISCGRGAECIASAHAGRCVCPAGTQGDPHVSCISVACHYNEDCADHEACDRLNRVCRPVCEKDTCGRGAECSAARHQPQCHCLPGTQGDPYIECTDYRTPLPSPECQTDADCPSKMACIKKKCQNPCSLPAVCSPDQECSVLDSLPLRTVMCVCPSDTVASADGHCMPIVAGEVECRVDSDCRDSDRCVRGSCKEACRVDPCGLNAQCASKIHQSICTCPSGYVGNPHIECSFEQIYPVPQPIPECTQDDECSDDKWCRNRVCVNPCAASTSCAPGAFCHTQNHQPICKCPAGFSGNPLSQCVPPSEATVGCSSSSECSPKESCINRVCVSPCNCGIYAECKVQDHYPICYCQPGYSGNPQIGCVKVGCEADNECNSDQMCYNGECINPCIVGDVCGANAECYGSDHRAKCQCLPGYIGSPMVRCDRVECSVDADCPTDRTCLHHRCLNPCVDVPNSPCAQNAICFVKNHVAACRCPEYAPLGNPLAYCHRPPPPTPAAPECERDVDCPTKQACIRNTCKNPCAELSPCSSTALCNTFDTTPIRTMVCTCPEGWVPDNEGECKPVIVPTPPGCTTDSECSTNETCINRMCRNPCDCGPNAQCFVSDHRPICSCIPGYDGNPNIGCLAVGCRSDSECASGKACINGNCINPCVINDPCGPNAECYAVGTRAECRCVSGYRGNPYDRCLVVGCRSNSDCPNDRACINAQCINPCVYEHPCAPQAECQVQNHLSLCRCPPDYEGNPYVSCRPRIEPECKQDGDCPSLLACFNGKCKNPCTVLEPCQRPAKCEVVPSLPVRTMICECPPGYISSGSGTCQATPPVTAIGECVVDKDCADDKSCINAICKNPCNCGPNAECRVKDHKPICSCLRGFDGNPDLECVKAGCRSDSDCSGQHACLNRECVPVCSPDGSTCGTAALCYGSGHHAVCSCPPGLTGDPQVGCIQIECETNSDCPSDKACLNTKCVSPCTTSNRCIQPAECTVYNHIADCSCPPGYVGTLEGGCKSVETKCEDDSDCPSQTACINSECVNPCNATVPCGINTMCQVFDTYPVRTMICECLPGYHGNAAVQCDKVTECPPDKGFVRDADGNCVCPPGTGLNINDECERCLPEKGMKIDDRGRCVCDLDKGFVIDERGRCVCPVLHGYTVDVNGNCSPGLPECTKDDDCEDYRYCNPETKMCDDPCLRSLCGINAFCNATRHVAVCQCKSGYIGDAYVMCNTTSKMRTDFPRPDMVVSCLSDGVQVEIHIEEKGFNGVLYVKGHSKDEKCRRVVSLPNDSQPRTEIFKVNFGTCGLIHVNGQASFVLVIQKHPMLVTFKTQAYHIKCVYTTGEQNVTLGFNVSMLTTAGTIANTGPPPTCLMRIVTQTGQEINSAEIGDNLKLQVDVQPASIYGGFARSCVAKTMEDTVENEYIVTDENGCATDPSIFGEWDYNPETQSLLANFNAFKFPSSDNIRFQCNIRVCFGKCQPVNCRGYNAFGRRRRDIDDRNNTVVEIAESVNEGQLREEITIQSNAILTFERRGEERFVDPTEAPSVQQIEDICVSMIGFIIAIVITALLSLVAVAVAVSCWLIAYRRRPKTGGPLPHPPEFPNPLFTTPEPLAEPSPDYLS